MNGTVFTSEKNEVDQCTPQLTKKDKEDNERKSMRERGHKSIKPEMERKYNDGHYRWKNQASVITTNSNKPAN